MTHKKRPKTNAEMRLEVVENELKQMKVDRAIDNIKNGMARLDGLMKTIKSDLKHDQQQALNFIQGQFMHQTVQAWVIQSAITRANNGLSGELSHSANALRRCVDLAPAGGSGNSGSRGVATESTPGFISEPLVSTLPRWRK